MERLCEAQHNRSIGLQTPKAAGRYKGRTPLATELRQEVISLAESGMAKTKIARQLNIGEATVYRILAAAKTA